MRSIVKTREPNSLAEHRAKLYSSFDNYGDDNNRRKEQLRAALANEQHYICCYCMGRITPARNKMKIEHWRPRSRCPEEQLDYNNMLGACKGGEGSPPRLQHCDTRKGNSGLKYNPANPNHSVEAWLRYGWDGSIRSNNSEFDRQLEDVLNLNLPLLRNNRKLVFDEFNRWLHREKDRAHGPVPRDRLKRKRDQVIGRSDRLTPYCQVAIWLLEQRL